jgi:protein-L-isoaspartate(D-aspartate) O-methyltransferase
MNETPLIDNHKQQGLRRKLIQLLREQGIADEYVLSAMSKVPRHQFLDSVFENHAYENKALPIDEEQTISQPYTVAFQTEKLDIQEGDRVLEIGTGSGYQTAVLSKLGAHVYTIERHKSLHDKTQKLLAKMGIKNVDYHFGDGFKGLPQLAPFDKIIITASPKNIPEKLIEQLKVNGKMILPIDQGAVHKMTLVIKNPDNTLNIEELADFKFVPMLKGVN